jgi:hypothetical protein
MIQLFILFMLMPMLPVLKNVNVSYAKASHFRHIVSHAPNVHMALVKPNNVSNGPCMSYRIFDASYVLSRKSSKVVAKYVGHVTRTLKLVFGVPDVLVTDVRGPKPI